MPHPTYESRRFPSADGRLSLFVRDYNPDNARVVLCLHGLTRNGRDFANLATHLGTGAGGSHRVIVADQRGRGQSDRDDVPAGYNLMVYVADMFAMLNHLGIDRVTIIGTSMGGLMAMMMAVTQPLRVRGLVLNDVGPVLSPEGLERIRSYVGKGGEVRTWADAARATAEINAQAFPDFGLDDWMAFARRTYVEDASGVPVPDYDPAIAQGLVPESTAVAPPDMWPLWAGLAAFPVLAIRGGLSDLLSAQTLETMAASHPDLDTLTLPNRGHAPTLDEPDARAAIDAFMRRQAAQP